MDAFRIERAIALVDPMGLLSMGAPVDEYSSESYAISCLLPTDFTKKEFLQIYNKVMKESFGGSKIFKTSRNDAAALLHFLFDSVDPYMRFHWGSMYRVLSSEFCTPLFRLGKFEEAPMKPGEIVTVVSRSERAGRVQLGLLYNAGIMYKDIIVEEERRMRWFFEEVGK